MPALASYLNVWNTCLVILEKKGFRTWTDEAENQFFAERDGWDFMADDPIQLLGLISIFESQKPDSFREYWWMLDKPWLVESLSHNRPEFVSVCKN